MEYILTKSLYASLIQLQLQSVKQFPLPRKDEGVVAEALAATPVSFAGEAKHLLRSQDASASQPA